MPGWLGIIALLQLPITSSHDVSAYLSGANNTATWEPDFPRHHKANWVIESHTSNPLCTILDNILHLETRFQNWIMDWDSRSPSFFQSDLKLLKYTNGRSSIAQALDFGQGIAHDLVEFTDEVSLSNWIDQTNGYSSSPVPSGVLALLCPRAAEPVSVGHNPATLLKVPFLRPTFEKIVEKFQFHISIVRAINRGCPIFSHTLNQTQVTYNLRTGNMQKDDIAMAVSSYLDSHLTKVIFFGCKDADKSNIAARLKFAAGAIHHPMLPSGIFVELQRRRHIDVVESSVTTLLQHITGLGRPFKQMNEKTASRYLLDLWIDIRYLSSCIELWQCQISKMIAHIDDLRVSVYSNQPLLQADGDRIKERLMDIIVEYEELRRKCAIVSDGTSLANGFVWNSLAQQENGLNRKIAMEAQRNSSQMKSIALLTMVFLPGTFVASFFAMPLFNWNPDPDPARGEKIYSNHFWIYWVVSGALTSLVIFLWFVWSRLSDREEKHKLSPA